MTHTATEEQRPDFYGQVHPVETDEYIARKRIDFAREIEALPEETKACLKQAHSKCPELLTDEFLLLFLRCEVYNANVR
jgi:hypothetical protein